MSFFLGKEPPQGWPRYGKVQLEHVSVRYAHDTDPVLCDITVTFNAGQKVAYILLISWWARA